MIKPIYDFYSNHLASIDHEAEISEFYALCKSPSPRNIITFFKFYSILSFILLGLILGSLLFAGLFNELEIEVIIFNLGLFLLSSAFMLFFRKFGWKSKFDYFSQTHMVIMIGLALIGILSIIVSALNNLFLDSLHLFYSFLTFLLSIASFTFLNHNIGLLQDTCLPKS